jgi:SAM-dependent methyltransferase
MQYKNYERLLSQIDLPFLETADGVLAEIFKTLEIKFGVKKFSNQCFIDLGSGNGKVVIYSARNYGIKSIGIEIDPNLVKEAKNAVRQDKKLIRKNLRKIKFYNDDFYTYNLKDYNFIYIYSLPTMQKYLRHVFSTAKIGTIFISHVYPLNGFSQNLSLKFRLNQNIDSKEISTYFYKLI